MSGAVNCDTSLGIRVDASAARAGVPLSAKTASAGRVRQAAQCPVIFTGFIGWSEPGSVSAPVIGEPECGQSTSAIISAAGAGLWAELCTILSPASIACATGIAMAGMPVMGMAL